MGGPRPPYRGHRSGEMRLDPPAPSGLPDACERTHTRIRMAARRVVHELDPEARQVRWHYITACGLIVAKDEATRTTDTSTCIRQGCVRLRFRAQNANGPPPG